MATHYSFKFPLANGLHARPASHLGTVAKRFRSSVTFANERTGTVVNAKSILSMIGADVKLNDPCRISFDGPDEEAGVKAVQNFVASVLPGCDEPADEPHMLAGELRLPRSLEEAGLTTFLRGTAVSGGVGRGRIVIFGATLGLPAQIAEEKYQTSEVEIERIRRAVAAVLAEIQKKIEKSTSVSSKAVLEAHLSIAADVALAEKLVEIIIKRKATAGQAIVAAGEWFESTLRDAQSAYLRERVLDVRDVCSQLLEAIYGPLGQPALRLSAPSVVVANHLTLGQFLALDRQWLSALVLENGGSTSHTVILARSMSIPTLVGVEKAASRLEIGREAVVDAGLGLVTCDDTATLRRYYDLEQSKQRQLEERFRAYRGASAITTDGRALEVGANIASAEEVSTAMRSGADGIGLFRTEMLFLDRDAAPGEEEQFQAYARAIEQAAGKPVTIRLFDIGGDKPAPYLNLPAEENPFLGYRGVRLYSEFAAMVKTQLRALLRASSSGPLKILVPMVSCIEEVRAVKAFLEEARTELAAAGNSCPVLPSLGIMLEVPAAVFAIDELCREVDFFSIGSNDLTQYFMAADRANPKVSALYNWAHPTLLRMMKQLVEQVHVQEKWIGLCGEMADSETALPLLIGLGLDEISLSARRVPAIKSAVSELRQESCKELLAAACRCQTRGDVDSLLARFCSNGRQLPLLSEELILQLDVSTKTEAIKTICDAMEISGRVNRSTSIEEAVWQREDTYSTGFGHGIAVPHCKSESLKASSICIARLNSPVEWGSVDDKPVDLVILLAVRADEHDKQHMRIFSRLSRLVMQEEFRDNLRQKRDSVQLLSFVRQGLGL